MDKRPEKCYLLIMCRDVQIKRCPTCNLLVLISTTICPKCNYLFQSTAIPKPPPLLQQVYCINLSCKVPLSVNAVLCPKCNTDQRPPNMRRQTIVQPPNSQTPPKILNESAVPRMNPTLSIPQKLFLTKFLKPESLEVMSSLGYWTEVLGHTSGKQIELFIQEGLIAKAGLAKQIECAMEVSQIKDQLRLRGIPISGNKEALAARLAENDPKGIAPLLVGYTPLLCTSQGRTIAERYLLDVKEKRTALEQSAQQMLETGDYVGAVQIVAQHESQEVFPRQFLGVVCGSGGEKLSEQYAFKYFIDSNVRLLKIMFSSQPKILAKVNNSQMQSLRVAAAMSILFGSNQADKWLPNDFQTNLIMDNAAAVRMLIFFAYHKQELSEASLNKDIMKGFQVSAANDNRTCPSCHELDGMFFNINNLPELPNPTCTCEDGCRCTLLPVTKSWDEIIR